MELKKIIINKSFILFISVMFFTDVLLFLGHASENPYSDEIYLAVQKSHAEGYKENVQSIIDRANLLNKISFTDNAEKNKKTIKDFENILNAEVKVENTKAIENVLTFDKGNIVFLVFTLYMVYMLTRDRKSKRAVFMVNKAKGRGYAAIKKLSELFAAEAGFITIIYVINIIASAYSDEGIGDLFTAVQSIPSCKNIVYNLNILEFILLNIIFKALVFFMIGCVLWIIYGLTGKYIISSIAFFAVMAVEYGVYVLMDEYNSLRFFKEINIFAILDSERLFGFYETFDFFTGAVNRMELVLMLVSFLTLLCIACVCLEYTKLYYIDRKSIFDKISDFLIRKKSQLIRIHSITGNELYKLLISGKGIIIVAVMSLIAVNEFGITNIDYTLQQEYVNRVYENYGGEVTDKFRKYVDKAIKYIETLEDENLQITEKYNNGDVDAAEYFSVTNKNQILLEKYSGIYTVQEKLAAVDTYNENNSRKIHLINERGYKYLIGNEAGSGRNMCNALIIICICAVTMNIYTKDKNKLIYVTAKGRDCLFAKKLLTLIMSAIVINLIFRYIFYAKIVRSYGLNNLSAPLQSIEAFRECELQISISAYLVLSEIMLFVGELAIVMLSVVLSQCIGYEYSLLIVLFLTGAPVLGEKAGVLNVKINIMSLTDINNIFMSQGIITAIIYMTAAVSAISAAVFMQYKGFTKYPWERKKLYES